MAMLRSDMLLPFLIVGTGAGAILADGQGIVAGHGRKMGLEALFAAGKTAKRATLQRGAAAPRSVGVPAIDAGFEGVFALMAAVNEAWAAYRQALRVVGVPYTDAEIAEAPKALEGKTELDALIAYLQMLGTMVDFKTYQAQSPANQR